MTAVESHRAHGTHVKFVVDRCRCGPCREANNAYERGRRARITPPYVSATPARRHVLQLRRQGVGLKTIAKASGVPHGSLSKLIYGDRARGMGPSKRIRPATSEKILAVTPRDAADGARVDASPSWEILDALIGAGMPKSQIAEKLGQAGPGLQLSRNLIEARHARTIAGLARQWRAGELTYERRWRGKVIEVVALDPPDEPAAIDPLDLVVTKLAATLEARTEQAEWRSSAACRGRPTWMWFPTVGDTETMAAAKRICDACFVRDECLAANLDADHGVLGGLSALERRNLRQQREDTR